MYELLSFSAIAIFAVSNALASKTKQFVIKPGLPGSLSLDSWMPIRPAFRLIIRRVALVTLLAIAAGGSTPADDCLSGDFLQCVDPQAKGLVSLPAGWGDNTLTPPADDSTQHDKNPFDASQCDALFEPYLLESQQFEPKSLTTERPPIAGMPMNRESLWQRIKSDHHNYYDLRSLKMLAGGFLIGAAVANTQLDQEIQDHFQGSVRGATSDDWFDGLHSSKELGNGRYSLPLFATAWAAGAFFDETPASSRRAAGANAACDHSWSVLHRCCWPNV